MTTHADLTIPMRLVLLDRYERTGPGPHAALYPGGQMRLINAGLSRRGLINDDRTLTDTGREVARAIAEQRDRDWTKVLK